MIFGQVEILRLFVKEILISNYLFYQLIKQLYDIEEIKFKNVLPMPGTPVQHVHQLYKPI